MKKISFSGHDKFDCKVDWLSKGLENFDKELFSDIEKGISVLGLGVNMIKSLKHWLKVFELADNEITTFGKIIIKNDIYFENIDSLWLLHYNIIKNQNATLYYLFFNHFYFLKSSKDKLVENLEIWSNQNNYKISKNTLKSDVEVFFKLYFDLFEDLNIFTKNNNYILNIGDKNFSDKFFLYVLLDFIGDKKTISMDSIEKGKFSLQKTFCLDESSLYDRIFNIEKLTNGDILYSEASGIKQLYIKNKIDKIEVLNQIYGE